jgi:hypothetical protein
MTSRRKLIVLSLLALVGLAVFVPAILQRLLTVYPTPETESAFLKNYTPEPAVDQFRMKESDGQWGSTVTAGAGREFASHQRTFSGRIAIDPKNWVSLMSSVSDDLSVQLSRYGAQILDQSGDARDGFRVNYKVGKTFGHVVISPLAVEKVQPGFSGKLQVSVDVSVEEKWFPKAPGLIMFRVAGSAR